MFYLGKLMERWKPACLLLLQLAFMHQTMAQGVEKIVTLDSVTIEAAKRGFNVSDFIDLVKSDTSFLKAFRNLHRCSYTVSADAQVFDKKKRLSGTLQKISKQVISGNIRWMKTIAAEENGKIRYRKGRYYFYTIEMLNDIFFPADTLPVAKPYVPSEEEGRNRTNNKNREKLKTLIFNPGTEVKGVPLIGGRMAIFDEEMFPHYDYSIRTDLYRDSISCYVFSCKAKKLSNERTDEKAVTRNLESWFDRSTFQIVARDYTLQYESIFFDLNVTMKIQLMQNINELVPAGIEYNGEWNIPFKKPEIVTFKLLFSNYESCSKTKEN